MPGANSSSNDLQLSDADMVRLSSDTLRQELVAAVNTVMDRQQSGLHDPAALKATLQTALSNVIDAYPVTPSPASRLAAWGKTSALLPVVTGILAQYINDEKKLRQVQEQAEKFLVARFTMKPSTAKTIVANATSLAKNLQQRKGK